ncbi:MAG: CPBP family intramembrane metalloprotease [Candidatus Eisenbacteria bacterium]|uniref:CPBP family intramembrane metalloprotease n=1 Tax=Eiseniibacteriota bacterium TaxID=2212470 RepID=A0A956LZW5_UNCEI|nr:CPBP family intramembrane metalloprotease [Candidatus Eisenbacteria bacterium]
MIRRILAVLEVLGVLTIGWFLTRVVLQLLPVPSLEGELEKAIVVPRPDFTRLAAMALLPLTAQAVCILLPAQLVSRFLRRESFLGKRSGGTSGIVASLLMGATAFCVFALPMRGLVAANQLRTLGVEPSYWALFDKPWDRGFWLFMAIGSFALIPVLEELVYRGYCQSRLERAFGAPAAVIGTSLLFAAVHFQYYHGDVLNITMLLSLFVVAIGIGTSYQITRSLAAPILVHALMNIPTKSPWSLAYLVLMLVGVILLRSRAALLSRMVGQALPLRGREVWACLPIAAFAVGMQVAAPIAMAVFFSGFIIALVLERRARLHSPSSPELAAE